MGRDRVRGRDHEIHTSTNTLHEHECERGDRAQRQKTPFMVSFDFAQDKLAHHER
jgi:hypothetical protein